MHALECPVEGGRRGIAVFQRKVDDLDFTLLQLDRGDRHPTPAQIFGKRNPRDVSEHALVVIAGTTGDPREILEPDFFR